MSLNAARGAWERRRALGVAVVAIALFSLYAAAITEAVGQPARSVAQHLGGGSRDGSSAVGVLLLRHRHPFCTASVVSSPRGDLLLTAAHCLGHKLAPTLMFAPHYYNGIAPLGEWHVTGQVFAPHWFPFGDANDDFAFLTVHGDVQARAGSEKLGYSAPVPTWVRLEGYSLTGQLSVCNRRPGIIRADGQQELRFACPGFENASSGGPFLVNINKHSGLGTIVGIIGGYQQGGDSPSVSYSSPFGVMLHRLYGSMTTAHRGLENLWGPSLTRAGW